MAEKKLPEGAYWSRVNGRNVPVSKEGVVLPGGGPLTGKKLKGKKPRDARTFGEPKKEKPGFTFEDMNRTKKGKFFRVKKQVVEKVKEACARKKKMRLAAM